MPQLKFVPTLDDSKKCFHGVFEDCNIRRTQLSLGRKCQWWHFYPNEGFQNHLDKFYELTNNAITLDQEIILWGVSDAATDRMTESSQLDSCVVLAVRLENRSPTTAETSTASILSHRLSWWDEHQFFPGLIKLIRSQSTRNTKTRPRLGPFWTRILSPLLSLVGLQQISWHCFEGSSSSSVLSLINKFTINQYHINSSLFFETDLDVSS